MDRDQTTMKACEIMSAPAVTVLESDRLKDVTKVLIKEGFNGLPVVDNEGELVGIVTEGDIVRLQEAPGDDRFDSHAARPTTVRQVMTRDVIAVGPEAGIGWVAHLMRARHLRTIPVTELQKVVGVITRRDLLGVIARDDDEIALEVTAILEAQSRTLGTFKAEVREGVVTLIGPAHTGRRTIAASLLYPIPGVVDVRTSVP